MKNFRLILLFISLVSILSCSDDNDINQNPELIGIWQRSDFIENPDFSIFCKNNDYKLYIYSDDISYRTHGITYSDGSAISVAQSFEWSTKDNQLTLDFLDGDAIYTTYYFNSDGQLILSELTDLPFNKLE